MYLFSNTENDYEGIDLFKLLMQTGNLWSRMPSLKADQHLYRSLLFFDTAEKAVMNNKCIPIEKYYKKVIECRMAQRSVLWKLAGSVNVGEKVGDLLYLRPFESSRRFFLKNEFDLSSPNVMPYDEEPITLTLEAALHKTLSYSFTTQRFAGPSEIWGMGDHTSVLSTDERSDPASYMSSNWKEYCKLMILTNDALLILVWPTDGTIWEIEYCLHEYPSKTILIMLPMSVVHNAEEKWNKSKDLLSTKYCSLPEYDPQGAFVFYNNNAEHKKIWNLRRYGQMN